MVTHHVKTEVHFAVLFSRYEVAHNGKCITVSDAVMVSGRNCGSTEVECEPYDLRQLRQLLFFQSILQYF